MHRPRPRHNAASRGLLAARRHRGEGLEYASQVAAAASRHVQAGGAGAGRRSDSASRTRPSMSPTSVSCIAWPSSTSRTAGTSQAATGVPHASASTGVRPNPSSPLGKTTAWAPV